MSRKCSANCRRKQNPPTRCDACKASRKRSYEALKQAVLEVRNGKSEVEYREAQAARRLWETGGREKLFPRT